MSSVVGESVFGQEESKKAYSVVSIVIALAGVIVVGFVASWVYAPLEHYIPLIYLNIAITYGMGWLIGKAAEFMVARGRINSPKTGLLIGGIGGLVTTWFCWLAYIFVIADYNFDWYFHSLNPGELFGLIAAIAHDPMWSLGKGGSMPAVLYYLVWLIELGIIVGVAAFKCKGFIETNKLCDQCNQWIKATGDVAFFSIPDDPAVTQAALVALEQGDLRPLAKLPRRPAEGDEALQWLEAKGFACADCEDEDSFVSVCMSTLTYNKKTKKFDLSQKTLAQFIRADVETEKSIFEPAPEPAAAAKTGAETSDPVAAEPVEEKL